MKIEKISIDKIKPYENNAKLHPPEQIEQIKKSIQEFGNNDPIAIDENSVIIEGFDLNMLSLELDSIDDFDMSDFGFEIDFEKENQRISENKEIDTNEFDDEKFDLECPRCGFRWNNE